MTWTLCMLVTATVGFVTFLHLHQHARSACSPEPHSNVTIYFWLAFFNAGVAVINLNSMVQVLDANTTRWLMAWFLFCMTAFGIHRAWLLGLLRRRPWYARQFREVSAHALALLGGLLLLGCSTYHISETRADGSAIEVSGTSLLSDKGIKRAKITGLGELDGYSANPSADVVEGFGRGLGEGLRGATTRTVP